MNIINRLFLRMTLLPVGLYQRLGVDQEQLKAILYTKLLMDDRRPNTLHQTQRKKRNKPVSLATLGTMLLSGLLGLAYLFSFSIGTNMITSLTVYFSMFFFMLSATLISDFTSVLIDVRDTFIILPKPVSDQTFLVAKLLHIFIHICKIVVPMSLAGIIYMAVGYGFGAAMLFWFLVLFVTAFAIFFINAIYLLILKITTPQKFQSIISYVQIILAILVYGSYQIFPRMSREMNLGSLDLTSKRAIICYPLYWFAAGWNVLHTFQGSPVEIAGAVLSLIVPFLSLFLVIKYLAPAFNSKLALISSVASTEKKPSIKPIKDQKSYPDFLSRLFTRSLGEKAGFLFTWKMTSRSRDFKLKVYPSIGYLAVYVVVMLLNTRSVRLENIRQQDVGGKVLVVSALYFTSFVLVMALNQMIYSEKYRASWIYYVSPLEKPGEIILGSVKAAILKFYIPLVVFITLSGILLVGPSLLPNIILGLFNELLIATILVYAHHKMLPFSAHQNTKVKTGAFLRNLFVMVVSGLIALFHFFIYDIMSVVIICALLSITATWLMMESIKGTSWETVKSGYTED